VALYRAHRVCHAHFRRHLPGKHRRLRRFKAIEKADITTNCRTRAIISHLNANFLQKLLLQESTIHLAGEPKVRRPLPS
jgi:hypothetical protein